MALPERYSLTTKATDAQSQHKAPNPKFLQFMRFLFSMLVCLMALATAIMSIIAVNYYRSHKPIVIPSWGSLIFLVVMGFLTSIMYFGYFVFFPLLPMFRFGSFLSGLLTMKMEVLFQFSMCAIWISGALAYACDFRGRQYCLFDGYYHYPKPSDWNHLCDIINWIVPMAYATFGIQAAFFGFEVLMLTYMFLFVDQDVVSEPFSEWGQRAYNFQQNAQSTMTSFNDPMKYRATSNRGMGGASMYQDRGNTYDDKHDRYYDEDAESSERAPSREKDDLTDISSEYGSSGKHSGRRGAAYTDSSTMSSDESNVDNLSSYHGGAYSRRSTNNRRSSLSQAPPPAAANAGSTLHAPSWNAPSITSDGESMPSESTQSPIASRGHYARQNRRVSAPVSLGARGRRGAAYGPSDEGAEDGAALPAAVSRARGRLGARNLSGTAPSVSDETGWHLRE